MTFRQLLRAVVRRWYIPLAVFLCAAGYSIFLVQDGGVYSTRTIVYFIHISPDRVALGLNNGVENEGLISFAGAVASELNNGATVSRYALDEAPLYGAGIRRAVRVGLPDVGGQWMTSFTRAEIEIQIVGPSREWVSSRQQGLLSKLYEKTRTLQGPLYRNPERRITAVVSPVSTEIDHISPSGLERSAAFAAMFVAATIVGSWGAVVVDRKIETRRRKIEPPEPGQEPEEDSN